MVFRFKRGGEIIKQKDVLFVSVAYPPSLSPESIQSSRYVKYLSYLDWKSTVVCDDHGNQTNKFIDTKLQYLVHSDVNIYPVKPYGEPWFGRILSYGAVRLPDTKIGWYLPAVKKSLSIIKEKDFDVIHSWAMDLTSNLVGLKLKRETDLPWISHFSDPWVDNPYYQYGLFSKYVNFKWERQVMEHSDAIIFVSEETRQLVMKKYSQEIRDKSFVIPHCFDPDLINQLPKPIKTEKNKFTLTFTGNFYGSRTPIGLFISLRNILRKYPELKNYLDIQIIGNLQNQYKTIIKEFQIENIVTLIDTVPYIESLKYIKSADVLLLIDAPSKTPSIFLPLKLIEYIGFKKPLLGITPLRGESASVIRKLRGYVVSPEDILGIENAILSLYEKFKNNEISDNLYNDNDIESYNAYNTSRKLADYFEKICV